LDALGFYVVKYCFPIVVIPDYGRLPGFVIRQGSLWFCLVPVVLAALASIDRERRLWLGIFCAYLGGGILAVLGLVSFSFQNYSTVTDRFSYLSLLALALSVSYLSLRWKNQWAAMGIAAFLAACGVRTLLQVPHWRDTKTLLRYTLRVNPDSILAHSLLANWLDIHGATEEGIEHMKAAIRGNGDRVDFRFELGAKLASLKRFREAEEQFSELVRLAPWNQKFQWTLAQIELRAGKPAKAIEPLKRVISTRLFPPACNALAVAYFQTGEKELAIRTFEDGVRRFPGYSALYLNWAIALERSGNERSAMEIYNRFLDRTPDPATRERLAQLYEANEWAGVPAG
jgi:tetratricopeptide (TPR) repeat protein